LRRRLPALAGGGALAAALWCDAGALAVERLPLRLGPDAKMRRLVRLQRSEPAARAGSERPPPARPLLPGGAGGG
jgi:hypothetical protein